MRCQNENVYKLRGIDETKHKNHCQCQWLCQDVTMLAGRKLTVSLTIIVPKKKNKRTNLECYFHLYTVVKNSSLKKKIVFY